MMKHTVQAVAVATAKVLKGNEIRNKPIVLQVARMGEREGEGVGRGRERWGGRMCGVLKEVDRKGFRF